MIISQNLQRYNSNCRSLVKVLQPDVSFQALYVAEHTARTAVETRASMQRHISLHDQTVRETNIRNVAAEALRDRHPTVRKDDNDLEV